MSKMYGPSDFKSVVNSANGHNHEFKKGRHVMPSYGEIERSLPVVDCVECTPLLKNLGFASHPDKVRKTADEIEFEKMSEKEGTIATKLMSKQLGETLARLVATEQNSK